MVQIMLKDHDDPDFGGIIFEAMTVPTVGSQVYFWADSADAHCSGRSKVFSGIVSRVIFCYRDFSEAGGEGGTVTERVEVTLKEWGEQLPP